jgi:putative flippase GtrA
VSLPGDVRAGRNGTESTRAQERAARGERFTAVMAAAVRHLPFGLARIVPPNLLGFAVINGFTFACDLALLTALRGGLRWPVAVSITLSYAIASGLSYLLNRAFNFHSHAAIGRQFATYVAVIAVNYLAWILGVGAGLAALGVSYQLARIIAGLCEAVYMYAAMRWLVFRDTRASPGPEASPGPRRLLADFLAHRGCCIFGFPGFLVFLLAVWVYGTPVQAG